MKKDRTLYALKYLWRNTDEDHPATTAELLSALEDDGISINRHGTPPTLENAEISFPCAEDKLSLDALAFRLFLLHRF